MVYLNFSTPNGYRIDSNKDKSWKGIQEQVKMGLRIRPVLEVVGTMVSRMIIELYYSLEDLYGGRSGLKKSSGNNYLHSERLLARHMQFELESQ